MLKGTDAHVVKEFISANWEAFKGFALEKWYTEERVEELYESIDKDEEQPDD